MSSAPYIRIGAMRSFVDLETKTSVPDGGGGYDTSWEIERKLWCRIRPLSGSRRLEAMSAQVNATHEIQTNYAPDVAPRVVTAKRLRDEDGAVYRIISAWCPENVHEFVVMLAQSGGPT